MKHRWLSILLITLLMLSNLSLAIPQGNAAPTDALQDGEYSLDFIVWKELEDEKSVADDYFEKPAKLIVENGEYTVQATLKNATWWQYFKVKFGEEFIDVTELEKNEEENTALIKFPIESLDEILDAKVHIIVTGIPGFNYDNKYDIRIKFEQEKIELIKLYENEVPKGKEKEKDQEGFENKVNNKEKNNEVENTEEKKKEAEDKQETYKYKNGVYELPYVVLKDNSEEVSVADTYFKKPATLNVKDGTYTVQATLKNASWWEYFKVAQGDSFTDVKVLEMDEDNDSAKIEFNVDDIDEILHAKVHIIVKGIPGFEYDNKYDIRLKFDTSKVARNDHVEDSQPSSDESNEPKQNAQPENPNNNNYTTNVENGSSQTNSKDTDKKICRDGIYDLPFRVLKADKDEVSVADKYFEKPAKLIVKDGRFTVETVLKNASWWQYFKVATENGFMDVKVIDENKETDTRVVQFPVKNPADILDAKVHIIVTGIPGFEYDNKYDIRLGFDPSGLPLDGCDLEDENPKVNSKEDGEKIDNNKDEMPINHGDPLSFDRDDQTKEDEKRTADKVENPKTADSAKLLFFASLLIASLIPLLVKLYSRVKAIKGI